MVGNLLTICDPGPRCVSGTMVLKKLHLSVQALSVPPIGPEIFFSASAICFLRGIYSGMCYIDNIGSAIRYHCKYKHNLQLPDSGWYYGDYVTLNRLDGVIKTL